MDEQEISRIDSITAVVNALLNGRDRVRLVVEQWPDDELKQLAEYMNRLSDEHVRNASALRALSQGNLDGEISSNTPIAQATKNLQAALRHLSWQTERVAKGDLSQRVDFMGEFSSAFNEMVLSLDRNKRDLERQNAELRSEIARRHEVEGELSRVYAAVEDARDAVAILEPSGTVSYANIAFGQAFRQTRESVAGKKIDSFFPNPSSVRAARAAALAGQTRSVEIELVDGAGTVTPVLLRSSGIMDENFNVTAVLFMLTNIAEQRKAQ